MVTMKDLLGELLFHIIFLLVQSSGGAEEFARIITVCRDFLLYAEDKSILRVVNFDVKMEPVNFHRFQNIKGLLVKCSEAGNESAQHVLGKVIMLSSTHLFLRKWQPVRSSLAPLDRSMLDCWIPDTNIPAQNNRVRSFMTYFSPIHVYRSKFSSTRLVHRHLVKLFLLNGSHYDFIEMYVFLKYCIKYFMAMGVTREDRRLIASIKLLYIRALCVTSLEKLDKTKESFNDYFRGVREFLEVKAKNLDRNFENLYWDLMENSNEMAVENRVLLTQYMQKCVTVGVNWQEALNDMNFVEALREDMGNRLDEAYTGFGITRAMTLDQFERKFG
ncbi:uncharacterized protein LOC141716661 [Apium graveolens]|uniref:uncharacterized protein LOC141716661 n=1 Tax=Apium graveolens TaxID=4045 RepID=UPI003D7A7A94